MTVPGIDLFKERLGGFANDYALIGGSACDLIFASQGLRFRATKDLDIVVLADRPAKEFAAALWSFIKEGEYTCGWRNSESVHFYRFTEPKSAAFPHMIELFARHPGFPLHNEATEIAPLPLDDDISSLSAILLDDAYYEFLTQGLTQIDGISLVDAAHIIPLKARAHVDLHSRKNAGQHVNDGDLKKHKKDVLRLVTLIPANAKVELALQIKQDMQRFIDDLDHESMRTDQLNLGMTLEQATETLQRIYGLKE